MSLYEVYILNRKEVGLKVRFKYWDHNIQYFVIYDFHEQTNKFYGKLDTNEEISYHGECLDWELYDTGEQYNSILMA